MTGSREIPKGSPILELLPKVIRVSITIVGRVLADNRRLSHQHDVHQVKVDFGELIVLDQVPSPVRWYRRLAPYLRLVKFGNHEVLPVQGTILD